VSIADEFAGAFKSVTKDLLREKKQRERSLYRASAPRYEPSDRITLRAAVSAVMAEAIAATSGNGTYRFPCRNLYYAVRPLLQRHTDDELKYAYFSQTLVVDYEREHGPIRGMYRDPRGNLHEPHTGKSVPLGTLEVADYTLPDYVFDKILYVEKEGLTPIFESADLAERFDMAIAAGKGQPVEAVRALFARAERGDYRLFVLHDADPAGYSIARTIAEHTRRMPHHRVDVVDLGLTVSAAAARGLETERFIRGKALPYWMHPRLSEQEREWFEGRQIQHYPPRWECTRVELNALTAPALVAYIEEGLEAHDAAGKVIPPGDVITRHAREHLAGSLRTRAEAELENRITAIVTALSAEFGNAAAIDHDRVAEILDADRVRSWRAATAREVEGRLDGREDLARRITELLAEQGIGT
jgi:hypothetical protein